MDQSNKTKTTNLSFFSFFCWFSFKTDHVFPHTFTFLNVNHRFFKVNLRLFFSLKMKPPDVQALNSDNSLTSTSGNIKPSFVLHTNQLYMDAQNHKINHQNSSNFSCSTNFSSPLARYISKVHTSHFKVNTFFQKARFSFFSFSFFFFFFF